MLKIYFPFPSFLIVGIFGGRGEEDSEQKQCCEVWQGCEVGEGQPQGGTWVGGEERQVPERSIGQVVCVWGRGVVVRVM